MKSVPLQVMAGIYIHIPFCKQKCTYCDFHFSTSYHGYKTEMIHAICSELELRKNELEGHIIKSIYFGGGTPSLLKEEQLKQVLNSISAAYIVAPDAEVTLEANPDDISPEKAALWKSSGINRLSIGIQSFDEKDLLWMNRAHTAEQAETCVRIAHAAGIDNISIDLIYGLPDMDNDRWEQQIRKALLLQPSHISAYCLTIEERTLLDKLVKEQKIVPASNEQQSDHFDILTEILRKNNYEHYEISNFALPGRQAIHNSSYWKGAHYIGAGPSAHSFNGHSRSWNIANNRKYIQQVRLREAWYETEELSPRDRFNELLLTGLRTCWGVDLHQLYAIFPENTSFSQKINEYSEKKWLFIQDDHLILTPQGKHWADAIAADLFVLE